MEKTTLKLYHVGRIVPPKSIARYVFLRKKDEFTFTWFEDKGSEPEQESPVSAVNVEEAMRLAFRYWKHDDFLPLICGFRYTLPERDEHGINAYFHQMVSSYSSMNGVYYDEELGNNCYVQNASIEARNLWQKLKSENRL